jgi:iron complex outermembrane receptor protein
MATIPKRRRVTPSLVLSPLFLGAALAASPFVSRVQAQGTGTLVGSVTSSDGAVAPDAVVQIVDLRRRARTDEAGAFRFEGVPVGNYLVQTVSPRYGTGVGRAEIESGQETRLDVRLDVSVHQEAIVVSARPDARSQSEVAQPVSVLSGEELSQRSAPTLGETLATQPGVSSTYFGPGSSRPVIRGLGGDRIRVLEDGVGVGDASNTSPDHAVSLSPLTATSIEVVRGPATLLYGSSAVGGVVNVLDERVPSSPPDHTVGGVAELLGASVNDEWGGGVSLKAGRGPLVVHGSFDRRESSDLNIPGFAESAALRAQEEAEGGEEGEEHAEEEEAFGVLPNSAVENTSGSVGASYVLRSGYFGAAWTGFDSLYGVPGGHSHEHAEEHAGEEGEEGEGHEGEEEEAPVRVDLRQRRLDFRGARTEPFAGFRAAKVRFGVTDYEHQELEGDAVGTRFLNDAWEGRLEMLHKPLGALNGSFGLQVASRDFEAIGEEAFVPPTETRTYALFAFEEVGEGSWRGQFGGRFEHQNVKALGDVTLDRSFGGVSGSAGLVYRASGGFGAGLTLAYSEKLPNAEELYANGPHIATRAFEIGDPDLGKEKSLGLDLSLSKRAGPVTGQVALFLNRFDDYIYEELTGEEEDGLQVVQFVQRDATFRGFEASAALELVHAEPRHLDLELQADYVRASLRGGSEDPLPRIPPFRYGATLHYHDTRLDGRFEVRGVSEQTRISASELPTEGYTFLNASLGYRFFLGRTILQLRVQGTNLTDEEGRNHVSFLKDVAPLPGRDFRASVRVLF